MPEEGSVGEPKKAEGEGGAPAKEGTKPETKPVTQEPGKGSPEEATITIGDEIFKAKDVKAIREAKIGLEKANKEMKKKIEEAERGKMSDLEKLQKDNKKLVDENSSYKKRVINAEIQRELDKAKIPLKAEHLNLGIEKADEVAEKVKQFIEGNPDLKKLGGEPLKEGSPGKEAVGSPAGATTSSDKEAQILDQFKSATTEEDLAKAQKAWQEYTGKAGPPARQVI